jgi:hypothetical protein
MRAAARLREDEEVATLNAQGDREAVRAALPFESARFLLHAGEAWATVGDREFARRRYQDALAMAVQHGFFEIRVKAEDALDALQREPVDIPQANLTASSVTSDPVAGALVAAGIGRLEALRG